MAAQFEKPRDVIGGGLIIAIGAGFLLLGRDLEMGTAFQMGPGYFPTVLSAILILIGAAMVVLALRGPTGEGGLGHLPWRGIVLVIGATLFFGLGLGGLGLIPVVLIVVLAAAWASRYASWRTSVPLALGMALFCYLVFIRGIGLPLPLVGPWLDPQRWAPTEEGVSEPAPAAPAAQ
jgi:Tripartite tricarboxylate transporter TctB family